MNKTIKEINTNQLIVHKAKIKNTMQAKAKRRLEQQKINAQDCYGCQKAKKDRG